MKSSPPKLKNVVRRPVALAAALLAASLAQAQVTVLPEVTVSGQADSYSVPSSSAATRTSTPIEQVPQSVVVIPRAMIEDQGARTVSDVLRNVSNVNDIDPRDANNVAFKIRGFSSAVVVDGVAVPGYFANQESLVNVEQIDVLKGPAGSLFGSAQGTGTYATLGGTVAITTSSPTQEPVRKVGLSAGSYGAAGASFDFNQPVSSELAVRLVGEYKKSDSESDDVFFRSTALFPSIAWSPNADTKVVAKGRFLKVATPDYSGLPRTGTLDTTAFTLPRGRNFTATGLPDTTTDSSGINVQWTQRLNDTWTSSVTLAHNKATINQRGAYISADLGYGMGYECYGFGVASSAYFTCGAQLWDRFETTTLSPSLTGTFEARGVKHVVNLGLDVESTKDQAFMAYSNGMGYLGSTDLQSPVNPVWADPVTPAEADQQQNTYKSRVVYLQDQASVGSWHLLGSLRYSKIDVTDVNPDPMFGTHNVSTNSKLTPRLGAVYDWSPAVSSFVGYSEGIKVPTGSNFAAPPKPEESKQKEIGLKLKNWEAVTATLAWFDLERTNSSVTDPMTFKAYQTGKQRSHGVDIDLQWRAAKGLTLLAALANQKAEIVDDLKPALVGKRLFNVPETTARLAARYDFQAGQWAGWGLGLGVTHHDKLPGNNTNTFFTPSAQVWDAQVSYQSKGARYGLNVSNLFDKQYFVPSAYFGGGQVIPAAPRALTASAVFSF